MAARVFVLNPPFLPGFVRSARWAARSRGRVQRHPDYLLLAVAVLEAAGHPVGFLDGPAQHLSPAEAVRQAVAFRPDVLVVHTTTPSIDSDLDQARTIRAATGAFSVLVGNHAAAEPEDTFHRAAGGVDRIVRGEVEHTLRELVGNPGDTALAGISWPDGGAVRHNPLPPPLDVDSLPFPAWRHISPAWYPDAGKLFPFLTLLSGRGCFARCTFCQDPQLFAGHRLRFRQPGLVVEEILHDQALFPDLREIMFETDTFTASSAHVRGVCEEILRREVRVTWSCNARVDMDLTLLPLMRRAGCRMLMVGFEFGTQTALDTVRKGTTLAQGRELARAARAAGLVVHGCFMVGAPGETPADVRRTVEYAVSLPLDTIQVSGICVYPGTELYRWARANGCLVPTRWRDWVSPTGEQVTLLSYPQLPKAEIDRWVDRALRRFYLRPRQIWRMVRAIRTWGDVRRKIYGAAAFVRYHLEARRAARRRA